MAKSAPKCYNVIFMYVTALNRGIHIKHNIITNMVIKDTIKRTALPHDLFNFSQTFWIFFLPKLRNVTSIIVQAPYWIFTRTFPQCCDLCSRCLREPGKYGCSLLVCWVPKCLPKWNLANQRVCSSEPNLIVFRDISQSTARHFNKDYP